MEDRPPAEKTRLDRRVGALKATNLSTMEEIIGADSPLRKLPSSFPTRQVLFFDGIRYSLSTLDLAHARLYEELAKITHDGEPTDSSEIDFTSVFLDAWAVVDNVHRLKALLDNVPGLKKKEPALQLFKKSLSTFEPLRHGIQHLNSEIPKLEATQLPVWGCLSWALIVGTQPDYIIHTFSLVPGSTRWKGQPLLNPIGRLFNSPLDHIELTAFGHTVEISETMRKASKFARLLEGGIEDAANDKDRMGSDFLLSAKLIGRDPSSRNSQE